MIQLHTNDQIKAAEALAFSRFKNDQLSRSIGQLADTDLMALTSELRKSAAPVAGSLLAGKAIGRAAKKVGVKALQLLRGRPATQLFKKHYGTGKTGIGAAVQRFKEAPGRSALQLGKGIAVPGAGLYAAGKTFSQ